MAMEGKELDRGRIRDDAVYRGELAEDAVSDKAFDITNSTSCEVIRHPPPDGDLEEAPRAIDAAAVAQPEWANDRCAEGDGHADDRQPVCTSAGNTSPALSPSSSGSLKSARRYTGRGTRRLPDRRILVIMRPVEVMEAATPRSCPYSIDHTQARPRTPGRMCDGCESLEAYPLSAWSLSRSSRRTGSYSLWSVMRRCLWPRRSRTFRGRWRSSYRSTLTMRS